MRTFNPQSAPVHHGQVRVGAPSYHDTYHASTRPVEQRTVYINNLYCDVIVELRSGVKLRIPSTPALSGSGFVIRRELLVSAAIKSDLERVLSGVDESSSQELQITRAAYEQQAKGNSYGGASILLDYPITLAELQQKNGSLYHHELDCVVSLVGAEVLCPHPYSSVGQLLSALNSASIKPRAVGFGYSVQIIDNTQRFGDRYLNINGVVYKVVAETDTSRPDGVYVTSNFPTDGALSLRETSVQCYTFEQASQKVGLYRTYEEALTLGDLNMARKEKVMHLEHANNVSKAEATAMKARHEIETLELTAALRKLEHERDAANFERARIEADAALERQRMKDHYESRSHQRKDTGEALKMLPVILTSVGAICIVLRTFMTSKQPKT